MRFERFRLTEVADPRDKRAEENAKNELEIRVGVLEARAMKRWGVIMKENIKYNEHDLCYVLKWTIRYD